MITPAIQGKKEKKETRDKQIFYHLIQLFLDVPCERILFCQRFCSVKDFVLSKILFCLRLCSVKDYVLSKIMFCQRFCYVKD